MYIGQTPPVLLYIHRPIYEFERHATLPLRGLPCALREARGIDVLERLTFQRSIITTTLRTPVIAITFFILEHLPESLCSKSRTSLVASQVVRQPRAVAIGR